jgi:hypothetical protein
MMFEFNYNCSISKRWWVWDTLFDRFRWYRRRCGGHWELWHIDVIHGEHWLQVQQCTHVRAVIMPEWEARPPLARGTPICKDWT